jgi:hypothetical protein
MTAMPIAITLGGTNLLLVSLLAGGPDPGPSAPGVLRGRALELVDQRGRTRARIDMEPGGDVVLRLLDPSGTIRVKLGAGADGSGLLLANDATEPGVHLLARPEGSSLRLADKNGRERLITP